MARVNFMKKFSCLKCVSNLYIISIRGIIALLFRSCKPKFHLEE